jgi:hypothetical protein
VLMLSRGVGRTCGSNPAETRGIRLTCGTVSAYTFQQGGLWLALHVLSMERKDVVMTLTPTTVAVAADAAGRALENYLLRLTGPTLGVS